MDLRHLRYFVAVAEELHFGRAARRLNISQPPLSQRIQDLEADLGLTLLQRDKRNVRLTPAGEFFYHRAQSILRATESAKQEVQRIARDERETLILGYMSAVMLGEFPPFLKVFHRQYPHVELKFVQMRSNEQLEALIEGRIDAGFVDLSVQAMSARLMAEQIQAGLILREKVCVALPKEHPLASRRKISLQDLETERFVALERHLFPSHYDRLVNLCEQAGFNPNIVAFGDQTPTVMVYVACGVGIYLAPELVKHSWQRYVTLVPLEEEAVVEVHMITRENNPSESLKKLRGLALKIQQEAIITRGSGS